MEVYRVLVDLTFFDCYVSSIYSIALFFRMD